MIRNLFSLGVDCLLFEQGTIRRQLDAAVAPGQSLIRAALWPSSRIQRQETAS
jgi:hypothetical protein